MIDIYKRLLGDTRAPYAWVLFEHGTCVVPGEEPLVPAAKAVLEQHQIDRVTVIHCRCQLFEDVPGWLAIFEPDVQSNKRVCVYVDKSDSRLEPRERQLHVALVAKKIAGRDRAYPRVIHVEMPEKN